MSSSSSSLISSRSLCKRCILMPVFLFRSFFLSFFLASTLTNIPVSLINCAPPKPPPAIASLQGTHAPQLLLLLRRLLLPPQAMLHQSRPAHGGLRQPSAPCGVYRGGVSMHGYLPSIFSWLAALATLSRLPRCFSSGSAMCLLNPDPLVWSCLVLLLGLVLVLSRGLVPPAAPPLTIAALHLPFVPLPSRVSSLSLSRPPPPSSTTLQPFS